jgi:hypothetical protein
VAISSVSGLEERVSPRRSTQWVEKGGPGSSRGSFSPEKSHQSSEPVPYFSGLLGDNLRTAAVRGQHEGREWEDR